MTSESATSRPRWPGRIVRWIEPQDNPTATVYGAITVGVLLAAQDPAGETYLHAVIAVAATIAMYWLAHGYARWLAVRLRTPQDARQAGPLRQLASALGHEWALVEGALVPAGVLLVAWAAGAGLPTAVSLAIWVDAGAIVALELIAAGRRRLPALQLIGNLLVGACLAAALIGIKLVLH